MSEERAAKRRKVWVEVPRGARVDQVEVDVSCNVADLLKVVHHEFHELFPGVSRANLQLYASKDSKEARSCKN